MKIAYAVLLKWQKDNPKFMKEAKRLKKTDKKKFLLHFLPKVKEYK